MLHRKNWGEECKRWLAHSAHVVFDVLDRERVQLTSGRRESARVASTKEWAEDPSSAASFTLHSSKCETHTLHHRQTHRPPIIIHMRLG